MKIKLENIGLIGNSEIEIDGITVMAGENATGKSTVGKALYSIFNAFHDIYGQIKEIRYRNIDRTLSRYIKYDRFRIRYDEYLSKQYKELISRIIEEKEEKKGHHINRVTISNYIEEVLDFLNRYDREETISSLKSDDTSSYSSKVKEDNTQLILDQVIDSLNIHEELIIKWIVQSYLNAEFKKDLANKHIKGKLDSEITLTIKEHVTSIKIFKDEVSSVEGLMSLDKEVIYIDDPYVIDDLNYGNRRLPSQFSLSTNNNGHRDALKDKILKDSEDLIEKIKTDEKLKDIYKNLETINLGDLVYKDRSYKYETEISLDVSNIATGLKTFVIIKTLLENGNLETNGTMILDEPEIHLHPKWQLVLAELIVLIQKEFNMHVLLNTHSPYFLNAIEVYSKHYGISDRCKYYLMELNNEHIAQARDVTGYTEEIYKLLVEPFNTLELF